MRNRGYVIFGWSMFAPIDDHLFFKLDLDFVYQSILTNLNCVMSVLLLSLGYPHNIVAGCLN